MNDNLHPQQFMYHEAHLNDRDSIKSNGLLPGKAWTEYGTGRVIAPAGVYLHPHGVSEYGSSMNDSSHFGYDRWRVNVTGLDIQKDPTQNTAQFSPDPIPADRIRLVKKGHPNWEKHI